MSNRKILAKVDTVIKLSTEDSLRLSESEKFALKQGEELEINWYRSASNNHWEFELESPKKGFFNWFAYSPHVEITGIQGFKNKLKEIAEREWEFFGKGTRKESEEDFWQHISKYWREGVEINYVNTKAEVSSPNFPWSAVFISWVMKQAGAGDKFKYSARHSIYIRDAIKNRKNNVSDARFKGYKIDEMSPEVGDLVCAAREDGVTYDTTTDYKSHCDLVVAKRANEIDIIGGNVSNSVTRKTLKLDAQGKVKDTSRPWFAIVKNLL
ncbi:MAG: DUF2272 domain-containing protein [Spirulina sp.]